MKLPVQALPVQRVASASAIKQGVEASSACSICKLGCSLLAPTPKAICEMGCGVVCG